MNIKELSKWADDQIFAKTGERLDTLQKNILEGVLEHPNFCKIADNNGYSYDYVREKGAQLWKILSDVFEEDIKQSNVRSILENKASSNIYNFVNSPQIGNINSHVNICRKHPQSLKRKKRRSPSSNSQNQSPKINQDNLPELNYNYGRKTEISTLKDWLENQTKLITIYGLSGIGKTALILKLIPEIQENFDYIFYRSLEDHRELIKVKNDFKSFCDQTQSLPDLIDYFKNYRCLLILDDGHNLFKTCDLAGKYLPEFKDYSRFLQKVASLDHQSCVILISWEKLGDLEILEGDNQYLKNLHLKGLGESAREIFKQKGLKDEDKWDDLINLYQGNPAWLNIIILAIKELYNSKVADFLIDQDELFLGDIESILENHLDRLSESENKVIHWLANQDILIDINQKYLDLNLSKAKFLQIIQSLIRRCLLKIITEKTTNFQLNLIFKAYLKVNK